MIWIDFDNSPHVPLLVPIAKELQNRGIKVFCTARDYTQTIPLLEQSGIEYKKIGKSFGKTKILKILSLFIRLLLLMKSIYGRKITLAINHGSRTQTLAAKYFNIPSISMGDYEYTESFLFRKYSSLFLCPKYIPKETLLSIGFLERKIYYYDGFKENIYLENFIPDTTFREIHYIPSDKILLTLRPPGTSGNYHDPKSELLCAALLERIANSEELFAVILPKNDFEKNNIIKFMKQNAMYKNWLIPEIPFNGLQLIWNSDLIVSGGGTMNREGALLGVPTYSIFTAKKGAVDQFLESKSKLIFLNSEEEVKNFPIFKRSIDSIYKFQDKSLKNEIVDLLIRKYNQSKEAVK